jgi:hypothetical protein
MQCPGQDTRYWKPGDIFDAPCPHCGQTVEFFKDESTRRCKNCGQLVTNPRMDFGCAAYCKYAEQCLGELSPELLAKRKDLLKDRVALEMKKFFRRDFKSIDHAVKVARYAEQIASLERADLAVLLAASYLHGIACPETAGEGPSAGAACEGLGSVQTILKGLGAEEEMVAHVLNAIVALREPRQAEVQERNAQILRDAHAITEWQERPEHGRPDGNLTKVALDDLFCTGGGKSIAEKILLKE